MNKRIGNKKVSKLKKHNIKHKQAGIRLGDRCITTKKTKDGTFLGKNDVFCYKLEARVLLDATAPTALLAGLEVLSADANEKITANINTFNPDISEENNQHHNNALDNITFSDNQTPKSHYQITTSATNNVLVNKDDLGYHGLGNPELILPPEHGDVSIDANGVITYSPTPNYDGLDSFLVSFDGGDNVHQINIKVDGLISEYNSGVLEQLAINDTNIQEIVFIDANVLDVESFLDEINEKSAVFTLSEDMDGVEQMTAIIYALQQFNGEQITAIHIISHGDVANLYLGNSTLNIESMNGEHANELTMIAQHLHNNADILIYGCNFGQGEDGANAAEQLSILTNADIAASIDLTGNASLGGDWDLEYSSGVIEAQSIENFEYEYLLAPIGMNNSINVNFGDTVEIFLSDVTTGASTANAIQIVNTVTSGNLFREVVTLGFFGSTTTVSPVLNGQLAYFGSVGLGFPAPPNHSLHFEATSLSSTSFTFQAAEEPFPGLPPTLDPNISTFTINVIPPVLNANDDTATTNEDNSVTIDVLNNDDTGAGIQQLYISNPGVSGSTLTITGSNQIIYDPANNFFGVDTFDYSIFDGINLSEGTVTVTVNSVNDLPNTSSVDSFNTTEGSTIFSFNPINNDTDVEDSTSLLSLTSVSHNDANGGTINFTAGSNSFDFIPDPDFAGDKLLTYTVEDTDGGSSTGFITFNFSQINDAPSGTDNLITIDEDNQYTFSLSDFGFSDLIDNPSNNFESIIIDSITLPTNATLQLGGSDVSAGQEINQLFIDSGFLTFNPGENEFGSSYASFTFYVRDDGGTANGGVDTSLINNLISFDVNSVDDPVEIVDDTASVFENSGQTTIDILSNDTVVDGISLISILSIDQGGTAVLDINDDVLFTPDSHFFGTSIITYEIIDGDGSTGTGTLTVTVEPVNSVPSGVDSVVSFDENTSYTITLADIGFSDSLDSPSNNLNNIIIDSINMNAGDTLQLNGSNVSAGQTINPILIQLGLLEFTPDTDQFGMNYASIDFSVQDDGGTANGGVDISNSHTIGFNVNNVNVSPTGDDVTITTDEDIIYIFTPLDFTINDADNDGLGGIMISSLPANGNLEFFNGVSFQPVNIGDTILAADLFNLTFLADLNDFGSSYTSFDFYVFDDSGAANSLASSTNTVTVDVNPVNDAPVISAINIPTSVTEGSVENYSVTVTDVDDILNNSDISWTFGDGNSGVGFNTSHVYIDEGLGGYLINVNVDDGNGGSDSASTFVAVANADPIIHTINAPTNIDEGDTINVSAFATDPGAIDSLVYIWNFGNGDSGFGQSDFTQYVQDGSYTITLTVMDNDGGSTTATHNITVNNVAPSGSFSVVPFVFEATPANIVNSVSISDPGADTLTYTLNLGDGNSIISNSLATIANAVHTYPDDDFVLLELFVSDDDTSVAFIEFLSVLNVDPSIDSISVPSSGLEGQSLNFSSSASDPAGANDPLTYFWDFGDGNTSNLQNPTNTYIQDGTYNVILYVNDDDFGLAQSSHTITIGNVPPSIDSFTIPLFADEGDAINFGVSASDVGINDNLSYFWNFGDGNTSNLQNPIHTYTDNGSYIVDITVSDGLDSTNLTSVVTVNNVSPTIISAGFPPVGIEGSSISFILNNFSDPGIDDTHTITWNFGDGNSATGTNVNHTYADNGIYNVVLVVTDDDGDSGFFSSSIFINNADPIIGSIQISPSGPINEGQAFNFSANIFDPGSLDTHTYLWNFGDGTTSTLANPTHTYVDEGSGTYALSLIVFDNNGGSDTRTFLLSVNNVSPTVSFDALDSGNSGSLLNIVNSVSVFDPGVLDNLSYTLDFGDGSTPLSTNNLVDIQNATHTYSSSGSYIISLTTNDGDGGITVRTDTINIINNPPVIVSSIFPSGGNEGDTFAFAAFATDIDINDVLTYSWDFGDGNSAVGQVVTHTYGDNDNYNVILTVSDGTDSVTDSAVVNVANVNPVIDTFNVPATGDEGSTINFGATISDPGTLDTHTFLWDFGDGNTSNNLNATHTYGDNGNYTVTLTVTDDDGGSSMSSGSIQINNVAPNVLTTIPATGDEGSAINFSATVNDPGVLDTHTFLWDFGDGNTSNNLNATHTYGDNGNYTVTLTVTDDDGDSTTVSGSIQINNVAPTVFISNSPVVNEGDFIVLSSIVIDPGFLDTHTFLWDFGDGNTSNSIIPAHIYGDNGNYTITLTVTDDDGGSTTASGNIQVNNVDPNILLATIPASSNEGSVIIFNAAFNDPGFLDTHTVLWDFGDGNTSNNLNPGHIYGDNGNYTVTLTVTDDDGGSSMSSGSIQINNVDPSAFIFSPTTGNEGDSIMFGATISDPGFLDTHTFLWDFGDGNTSNSLNPTHVYGDNGNYTVTFTVTDDDGGTTSLSTSIPIINVDPSIDSFTVIPSLANEGDTVGFVVTISDPGFLDTHTFFWDFGDGNTLSGPSAIHTYGDDGNYTVTLTVTDDDGGTASQSTIAIINNVAPIFSGNLMDLNNTTLDNATLDLTNSFTDPAGPNDPITYQVTGLPAGLSLSGNVISGQIAANAAIGGPQNYVVTVIANDGDGGISSATFNWLIDIHPQQITDDHSAHLKHLNDQDNHSDDLITNREARDPDSVFIIDETELTPIQDDNRIIASENGSDFHAANPHDNNNVHDLINSKQAFDAHTPEQDEEEEEIVANKKINNGENNTNNNSSKVNSSVINITEFINDLNYSADDVQNLIELSMSENISKSIDIIEKEDYDKLRFSGKIAYFNRYIS